MKKLIKSTIVKIVGAVVFLCIIISVLIFVFSKLHNSKVSVVLATDDNYFYPALVTVTSMLENKNKNTFYEVYVMASDKLSDSNKENFLSIKKLYSNCSIEIIDMNSLYEDAQNQYYSTAAYYRLKLASYFPKKNKILYIDSDTLVRHDLYELYSINIDNYYIAGVADFIRYNNDGSYGANFGLENLNNYVNSGVLLFNLKKIREDNVEKKLNEFVEVKINKEKTVSFPDQDALNTVCYNNILDLPFKYNTMIFGVDFDLKYSENEAAKRCFSEQSWEEGVKDAYIVHYISKKPWKTFQKNYFKYYKEWWNYAEKTPYYNEIVHKYKNDLTF